MVPPILTDGRPTKFVNHFFELNSETKKQLASLKPTFGFGGFGETVYYRTYSRKKPDGGQEQWADTVARVVEGAFSIRKNHYIQNNLGWNDDEWQEFATGFAKSMFAMEWLPPGRGLWAMGTDYVYSRGSAALFNCGFASTKGDLLKSLTWCMDQLMCGVGIGIDTEWDGEVLRPDKSDTYTYVVPDKREGWVSSLRVLLEAYIPNKTGSVGKFPIFDYSSIRKKGTPLKGFGGTASGPDPLIKLHNRVEAYLDTYLNWNETKSVEAFIKLITRLRKDDFQYMDDAAFEGLCTKIRSHAEEKTYDKLRLVVDIANAFGACVVAGNIRRGSEIVLGPVNNETFLNLKNYEINPERQPIAWMSNNSVKLTKTEDFHHIPDIASRIRDNGEPGFANFLNISRFGRVGRRYDPSAAWSREHEMDKAVGMNPCGEISLESFELCNLAEVFPTRNFNSEGKLDEEKFLQALRYATFYTSTVSLLPTHHGVTNQVIARNRRIGVSISGVADLYDTVGFTELTRVCRAGYKVIREENTRLAQEAGVPPSIRVTTIKPSGSISLLAGASPGMHFPTFRYAIRRIRVFEEAEVAKVLLGAGLKHERDVYSDNTLVFEFPIDQGKTRAAKEVTIWEQFAMLSMLQREWSDNSVSFTGYFNPETEGKQLEQLLAIHAPTIKGCSLLPHTESGVYAQAPYEGITKEKYEELREGMKIIDWSSFGNSDGQQPLYCTNDTCTIIPSSPDRSKEERAYPEPPKPAESSE